MSPSNGWLEFNEGSKRIRRKDLRHDREGPAVRKVDEGDGLALVRLLTTLWFRTTMKDRARGKDPAEQRERCEGDHSTLHID